MFRRYHTTLPSMPGRLVTMNNVNVNHYKRKRKQCEGGKLNQNTAIKNVVSPIGSPGNTAHVIFQLPQALDAMHCMLRAEGLNLN